MKAKIKYSHATKHQQDNKIMQLSDFPELSDQELELLVGGWVTPPTPPTPTPPITPASGGGSSSPPPSPSPSCC